MEYGINKEQSKLMQVDPSIAVITVVYNNVTGIEKTIQSVIDQTYNNKQYIIIDGGSTDGTVDIIKKYQDKISFWISEPDKGIYNAMNKGIVKSKTDYIMFLNSGDDFFEQDIIDRIVRENDNKYDIIYNNLNIIASNDKSFIKTYPKELSFNYFTYETLPHPATLIKRELFSHIGMYDENLKIVSDWKWFLLAICKYEFTYKNSEIIAANFYLDGISSSKKYKNLISHEKSLVLKDEFSFNLNSSVKLKRHLALRLYKIRKILGFH
ncbi:glycosyltransferase family 2 protein [Proteiniphilum sp. UBA5384]|uniref:glycosyltransferase family 2 protein n=1 Tax=Proteiniphilum sp. UBA5384 TaxID=1947279 RepID=UPI0025F83C1C|nr:glycosyltransferase family 2 protein [Proteiniphilum sp. UBA5384]